MKVINRTWTLGLCFALVLLLDVAPSLLVPEAGAQYGIRRRTARRTAVVVGSAAAAETAQAEQEAAAAEQQAAAAEEEAAAARQEAAAAQAEADSLKQAAAAEDAAAQASGVEGALPLGSVVSALPEGCTKEVIDNVPAMNAKYGNRDLKSITKESEIAELNKALWDMRREQVLQTAGLKESDENDIIDESEGDTMKIYFRDPTLATMVLSHEVGHWIDSEEIQSNNRGNILGHMASLFNYTNTQDDAHRWLGSVYVTWSQSPFVKYRIEYNQEDGSDMGEEEHRVMFQVIFAAGPHKHERY